MHKNKLLVRIMKCSGHEQFWYNHPAYLNETLEVYLERDCYRFIQDTDEQRYVVAEDYDKKDGEGYGAVKGIVQADCVILQIIPARVQVKVVIEGNQVQNIYADGNVSVDILDVPDTHTEEESVFLPFLVNRVTTEELEKYHDRLETEAAEENKY